MSLTEMLYIAEQAANAKREAKRAKREAERAKREAKRAKREAERAKREAERDKSNTATQAAKADAAQRDATNQHIEKLREQAALAEEALGVRQSESANAGPSGVKEDLLTAATMRVQAATKRVQAATKRVQSAADNELEKAKAAEFKARTEYERSIQADAALRRAVEHYKASQNRYASACASECAYIHYINASAASNAAAAKSAAAVNAAAMANAKAAAAANAAAVANADADAAANEAAEANADAEEAVNEAAAAKAAADAAAENVPAA